MYVRFKLSPLLAGSAIAVLASLSMLASSPALAARAQPQRPAVAKGAIVTSKPISRKEAIKIVKYWTLARRRKATPPTSLIGKPSPGAFTPTGKPVVLSGGPPAGHGKPGPAMQPDSNVPAGLYTQYPYAVNGVLFFINHGNHWCSATVVTSFQGQLGGPENEIWTAGTCVANVGGLHPNPSLTNVDWDTAAMFVPAYNQVTGAEPFGTFAMLRLATTSGWAGSSDPRVNEGAMLTYNSSVTGHVLGSAVGYSGFGYNASVFSSYDVFGYSPTDLTHITTGPTIAFGLVNPIMLTFGAPGGPVGGPWDVMWRASPASPGYINGVSTGSGQFLFWQVTFSPYMNTLSDEVRCFSNTAC